MLRHPETQKAKNKRRIIQKKKKRYYWIATFRFFDHYRAVSEAALFFSFRVKSSSVDVNSIVVSLSLRFVFEALFHLLLFWMRGPIIGTFQMAGGKNMNRSTAYQKERVIFHGFQLSEVLC